MYSKLNKVKWAMRDYVTKYWLWRKSRNPRMLYKCRLQFRNLRKLVRKYKICPTCKNETDDLKNLGFHGGIFCGYCLHLSIPSTQNKTNTINGRI